MATLAELQSEHEALRAAQAKQDFEAALAKCVQADLVAAAQAVRVLLLESILGDLTR